MVFRLPTPLESLIPPPSEQMPLLRPFRGTFVVNVADGNTKEASQDIRITAVEIQGDNRVDLWPSQLFVYMTRDRSTLNNFRSWVKRHAPPVCTFMPDRVRDPNSSAINQKNFGSLSRILLLNQMVAIAPWNPSNRLPGGGIVLYPSQNSSNLLYGAVFLSAPFPDFLAISPHASYAPLPILPSPRQQPAYYPPQQYSSPYEPNQYDPSSGYPTSGYPSPTHYASPNHYDLSSSGHPTSGYPSPTSPSSPLSYTVPRLVPDGSLHFPTMISHSAWSSMTDPDDESI